MGTSAVTNTTFDPKLDIQPSVNVSISLPSAGPTTTKEGDLEKIESLPSLGGSDVSLPMLIGIGFAIFYFMRKR